MCIMSLAVSIIWTMHKNENGNVLMRHTLSIEKQRRDKHQYREHQCDIIRDMEQCTESEFSIDQYLRLASIYKTGVYPFFMPNTEMARDMYTVGLQYPDPEIASYCRIALLASDDIPQEEGLGDPIPVLYGHTMMSRCPRVPIIRTHQHQPQPRPQPQIRVKPQTTTRHIPNDAQNVHDHSITSSIAAALHKDTNTTRDSPTTMEQVRAYILDSDQTPETKSQALEVLDSLHTEPHSRIGSSEQDVLNHVWTKCDALDEKTGKNAKDILVSQLASGVERDAVVCSTGKIARMMGTFDGLDTEKPIIRPMWAVREEIASLAGKMRDSPDAFKAEVVKTYVDDLGMKPEIVHAIADEYAEHM